MPMSSLLLLLGIILNFVGVRISNSHLQNSITVQFSWRLCRLLLLVLWAQVVRLPNRSLVWGAERALAREIHRCLLLREPP